MWETEVFKKHVYITITRLCLFVQPIIFTRIHSKDSPSAIIFKFRAAFQFISKPATLFNMVSLCP